MEIDQLRADVDDLEQNVSDLEIELDQAYKDLNRWETRLETYKVSARIKIKEKFDKENKDLINKCIVYTDCLEEMDRILNQYISKTGVMLVTTKLKELMKKGDMTT